MEIRQPELGDRDMLVRFLARVPAADRTFFKEDVTDPAVVEGWMAPGPPHMIAIEDGEVVGWLSVVRLHGWSSHVGELRLIVDPEHRGRGIGRTLARRAVLEALELGLEKVVVEVIAVQEPTIAMFRALGFDPEALLADHVRDQAGDLRDLMVLSHSVDEQWSSIITAGIADDI
jgi:ribosomal protein S18 acetylase RimI-like enzyme